MTSPSKPEPANSENGGEVRDRCLLYLLGEMNLQQAAAFEAELSESTELQTELASQSDMIVSLASIQNLPSVEAPVSVESASSSYGSKRMAMTLVAIATCVMIAFLAWPSEQADDQAVIVNSTPESLLIAHAWAEGSLTGTSISDLAGNSEAFIDSDVDTSFAGNRQKLKELDDESSLSWIVTAVEAGAISDG